MRPGGRSPRSSGEGGRLPARERPSAPPPTLREAFDLLVVPTVVLAAVVVAGVVAVVA